MLKPRTSAHAWIIACCVVLFPFALANAATIIPPTDLLSMLRSSELVVLAEAAETRGIDRGQVVVSQTEFHILEVLAGADALVDEDGNQITVQTPGGRSASGREWQVAGSPRFEEGAVYLLALDSKPSPEDGTDTQLWRPKILSYGILREDDDAAALPILAPLPGAPSPRTRPDGLAVEPIGVYPRDALLAHLRVALNSNTVWEGSTFAIEPSDGGGAAVPAGCRPIRLESGEPVRWRAFDNGGRAQILVDDSGDGSLASGGFTEIVDAFDHWHDITRNGMNLILERSVPARNPCSSGDDFQSNTIFFDDPCDQVNSLDNCTGVLAFAGPMFTGTHTFDRETWITVGGWFVFVNEDVGTCIGSANWTIMMAHELGHGLGFDHVGDESALMWESCCNLPNNTDRTCSRFTYPPQNSSNLRPSIDLGGNISATLARDQLRLQAVVSDDDLPDAAQLDVEWRAVAGPGSVRFLSRRSDASEVTAIFSAPGDYTIAGTVDDGQLIASDAIVVSVETWAGTRGRSVFQQGVGGYRGTVDTSLLERAPTSDRSADSELGVDSDDGNTGQASQALMRFEDLFGAAADQIPAGANILNASLELTATNLGDGARLHAMVEDWDEDITWNDLGNGAQPGTNSERSPVAETPGNLASISIDVTPSLESWSESPCDNLGWAFIPIGDDGWDFYSSEGDTPPRLTVDFENTLQIDLVPPASTWSYLPGSRAPPEDWNTLGFVEDGTWRSGPSGFGFGDDDDATPIAGMRDNYLTLYTRREFDVDTPLPFARAVLDVDYDDGFVAYINGVEIARSQSLEGVDPVLFDSPAESHEAGETESYLIDASLLQQGSNVIAVEVHNSSLTSSDLSLAASLRVSTVYLDESSTWRFLRGTEPVRQDWTELEFDDSAWSEGQAGFGYGDGDDLTLLDDMRGSYVSVFCRHTIALSDAAQLPPLTLSVIFDDGISVHINGQEIGRRNMPGGLIDHQSTASSASEASLTRFDVDPAVWRDGQNVIAISVHNTDLDSSDLSLVPILHATTESDELRPCRVPPPPPELFQRGDATGDGRLDLTDVIRSLNYLFLGSGGVDCLDAADTDDNGEVAVTDAIRLLAYLFQGESAPSDPGINCGPDPSDDPLPPCTTPACEA